ncbi:hypothetical protein M3Y97_00746200 [Aphelenchoides bicaudatus]|nr:hypothetical protein M3Y97_00746200 [Aphelenchoides bicaudatus]
MASTKCTIIVLLALFALVSVSNAQYGYGCGSSYGYGYPSYSSYGYGSYYPYNSYGSYGGYGYYGKRSAGFRAPASRTTAGQTVIH